MAMELNASDLSRGTQTLTAFRRIMGTLNGVQQSFEDVATAILNEACGLISACHGSLVLLNHETQQLKIVAAVGRDWSPEKLVCSLRTGEGITGRVFMTGEPYLSNDTLCDPHYFPLFEDVRSELAVPVVSVGRVQGVINIDSMESGAFSDEDVQLLRVFADYAALALDTARNLNALEAARKDWQSIVDSMEDGVLVCSPNLVIQRANQSFSRMFGVGNMDLTGRELQQLEAVNFLNSSPEFKRELAAGAFRRKFVDAHFNRNYLVQSKKILFQQRPAFLLTFSDTTDQDLLVEKMNQSEKLAAVGQMVASLAHELTNPLQSVIGHADLLLLIPASEQVQTKAAVIQREARRSTKLVRSLLMFSRSHKPNRVSLEGKKFFDLVIGEWSELYRQTSVHIMLELVPPEFLFRADPMHLEQVLHNLLNNAQQAMLSAGTIQAKIKIVVRMLNDRLICSVSDNGPGVPSQVQSKLFQPFFTTKPLGLGTGLGLALCRGLIEAHGGTISCRAQPTGACFAFELPSSSIQS